MKAINIMENTIENKEKFFAQYWGQEVAIQNEGGGTGFKYQINESTIADINYDYLLLKPLSSITDEDKNNLEVEWAYSFDEYGAYGGYSSEHRWSGYDFDYLRSCGYALPFLGTGVDELVKMGWIKLASNESN